MNIGLIDYERGNLRSVEKALERAGSQVQRIHSPKDFQAKDAVVLPGVGAFGDAMNQLNVKGLVEPIWEWFKAGKPFLGICLGYQLLFESSEENAGVEGLGCLPGKVVQFPETVKKVPHMGWNKVVSKSNILNGAGEAPFFYHVHSYYPVDVPSEWIACETEYDGVRFVSGVGKGRAWAFQFHPEKSQENGRILLENWVKLCA